MSNNESPDGTTVRSGSYRLSTTLQKAFGILECIAANQPVGAPVIRKETGQSKGNIHRILATLETLGYVDRVHDRYSLSFKMFSLGNTVPGTRDIAEIARPYLRQVADDLRVHCYLTVPGRSQMLNLDRVRPNTDIQVADDFAVAYGLHCTASGKLYLSTLTPEQRRAVYETVDLSPMTERTMTDPAELEAEVARIRGDGYATERGEHGPNINGIAAPILDHTGSFVASLSIAGPTIILDEDQMAKAIPRIVADAVTISTGLGARRRSPTDGR